MKTTLAASVGLCLLAQSAFSESFTSSAKGTTAGTFLELGVGGRATAMGGAYTAVADDATALYWNPAGLASVEKHAATFMHAAYLQSSFYDYGAYAQSLGDGDGAFGASFQYLSAGSLTETDANFNSVGTFTPNDLALTAGYGRAVGGGAVGASVKYIRSSILQTAQTAAVDLGALSPWVCAGKLRLGAALLNAGGTLKYEQSSENLPLTLKAGGAYRASRDWLWSADVAAPRDNAPYFALGTEYLFPLTGSWSFAGRMGYSSQTMLDVTGVTGFSVGIGLGSGGLAFDYAFAPYGGVGITNRFSLSAKF